MPDEAGVDTVRRFIREVVNLKNIDLIDEVFTEDIVHHGPREDLRGHRAMREAEIGYLQAFPDEHVSVDDQVEQGDRVALRWTWSGTSGGGVRGISRVRRESDDLRNHDLPAGSG